MPSDFDRQRSTESPHPEATRASDVEGDVGTTRPDRRTASPSPGRTRASATFISLVAGAVILILLLVFILENTERVPISYFGATGHISLGLALLIAVVAGAVLVGLAGSARILQLRYRMTHHH